MYLTQFDQIRNNIRHNLAFDDQITSDESRKRGKELRNQTHDPHMQHGIRPKTVPALLAYFSHKRKAECPSYSPFAMSVCRNPPLLFTVAAH